ncbi:alpha-mannosidase [Paenibacillus baekrokdamisoli]|uniref:alpha-mannosidase n=1 Tax=Paenibacillus baekrokdamisoli TaxID=1712516 RepID=A0A3G9J693_9BACL|nr:alpha-mannosidase [Paenibacillus baekrokdamisoli]MBB3069140.1 alpha-mannosidase [Paenibacillus baekrokdamisoli]BBH18884.1 alpha-mannosidase [Paenibacillus baekrokdamisoli]
MYRILRFIKHLSNKQWLDEISLREWEMRIARYIKPGEYEYEMTDDSMHTDGRLLGRHGITYFLSKQITIPSDWAADTAGLTVEGGGEGLLRVNGASYHGLSRNHWFVPLYLEEIGSQPFLEIELYDPIPEPVDPLNAQSTINPPVQSVQIRLVRVNKPLQSLLYSVKIAYEAMLLLPEKDLKRSQIMKILNETMDETYRFLETRITDHEWIRSVEDRLTDRLQVLSPTQRSNGLMHMVGQSHIDVAWLWPVRETVRKVSRTFSTMMALMEEYPDFIYSQSQPLLYAFAKEHDPDLYKRIKERIAEGRWELVGGMWVEPDLNIPSGESLVRQMLYGQTFYQEEFGKRSHIEWLPDTFGYCASLPQLLKLAGVDYFMTTKLNWNDTNKFPYELFHWVGIDGTSIISYLNHGLNEHTNPKEIQEHWEAYRQKDKLDELMLLYGHGDGGGGVTRDMVEFVHRSPLMTELPASQFSTAAAFFEEVGTIEQTLPQWQGDLYLELHRGTYTTHARNKRSNRKAEVLYREAEVWNHLALAYLDKEKDHASRDALQQGWKLILCNQFHDIIPGTSIPEVYETSTSEYKQIFELGNESLERSLQALVAQDTATSDGISYVVFNSLGWDRDEVVEIEGDIGFVKLRAFNHAGIQLNCDHYIDESVPDRYKISITVPSIPAFGYTTIWLKPLEDEEAWVQTTGTNEFNNSWETDFYKLEFNAKGEIIRWLDKTAGRELLSPGSIANELQLFHDRPLYWDAWDIDSRFDEQRAEEVRLVRQELVVQGKTVDILRFQWELNQSVIYQDIILYHHQKRVDFKTRVLWYEEHKLLKVAFPNDIVTVKATYEIPFGALERPTHNNTSWEQAQYEVCGHRWADLSEGGYGVSLLNDCKYGYDVKGSTMRLSLLRAPRWPDLTADQGSHEFTYSLFPHEQDWRSAHVVRKAAELNHPVTLVKGGTDAVSLPSKQSFVDFNGKHVVLDTIKAAERGEGTIYRFYESSGGRETVRLGGSSPFVKAYLVNLLEEEMEEIPVVDGIIVLNFKAYQIISVKCV